MIVVTRLAKVPAGVKVPNQQYGGELLNEQVWLDKPIHLTPSRQLANILPSNNLQQIYFR